MGGKIQTSSCVATFALDTLSRQAVLSGSKETFCIRARLKNCAKTGVQMDDLVSKVLSIGERFR